MDDQGEWYYCLKHHAVEAADGCKAENRLGPYPTQADAANALQEVQQNNDKWDAEDRAAEGDDGWGPFKG